MRCRDLPLRRLGRERQRHSDLTLPSRTVVEHEHVSVVKLTKQRIDEFGGADRLRKFGPGGRHAGLDEMAIDDQPELERIHR